ncbi:proline racemase family protein [Shewanella litorisediminis]|uniref:Proline racemase family protein n=1 Tax=Shewanella litorisediminis TaxID=1173586 RepID=A0ABX7G7J5_9GAMM|nr:proline racemase family protein [Shewanella litorisediminis]MCL2919788.1 proline racemase family protein [Shewanella litorisediminis]QRH03241.1 proline racemase family protein [Shewanella litorisediminis]
MGPVQLSPELLSQFRRITTLDAHTEGEPLRIITSGYPDVPGDTILEKRQFLTTHLDEYRQLLMFEPRGHADMYGALLTEPVSEHADFGVLFLHNEGYSSMCGHAVLALATVLCQTGAIAFEGNRAEIGIDAPAGFIRAFAEKDTNGRIQASFLNVPSWAEALDLSIDVPGIGKVKFDIGFGGAYYAYVDADALGLDCSADNLNQLIDWGRRIKQAVMASYPIKHPLDEDLSFLYGTIFTSKHTALIEAHSRHVCIFADGEVDRSPTGTGVAGRIALLRAKGEVGLAESLTIESIVGGKMQVEALEQIDFHGKDALIPKVSGRAFMTGQHTFLLHPDDIFQTGFLLR